MNFLRNVNPTGAIADFRTVFREAGGNRWRFAVLAAMVTFGMFSVMAQESWKGPRARPEIIYITSWRADRTEAETQAFIKENQRRKDEEARLIAEQQKVGQDMWKTLGRVSGMDVDKIAAQAEAERAKADAQARAKAEALVEPAKSPVER
ncbi:MAG: hypothetical protein RL671_116 [Pseudomonadota bacterium]|jgi:hypothetical protein|uniref:hypothetical protein n=1 Tax=Novosphingobium sp. APW14 TaxID=3077237 RepID=UPI0028DF4EE3|nr:hypothetical protein [Novosphingobium sp. APW14]MDT9013282.1 hypothetical protein [Novosphingobium sp. APW14]